MAEKSHLQPRLFPRASQDGGESADGRVERVVQEAEGDEMEKHKQEALRNEVQEELVRTIRSDPDHSFASHIHRWDGEKRLSLYDQPP